MNPASPPDRDSVNALCATLPGAEVSDPWGGGHDVWKVGGKMFAGIGAEGRGISVKTDSIETAALLIETGAAEKAPYLHSSWVLVPWAAGEDELRHRVTTSYRLIRGALTKKAQAALAPFD
ncbi:MAG: MmcQ/YjbR family DNA-binding protein [Pararhodobacter sp.]